MPEVYKDLENSLNKRTAKEQEEFNKGLENKYRDMSIDELELAIPQIGMRIDDLRAIVDLEDVIEIVSISYIAKKYFNKSRAWLAQRINGNIVNGKPAQLSAEERQIFKLALEDIAKKMQTASSKIELV